MYRRILGPVYDNEKENWGILTNKEIYASVKNPTIIETKRLNRLRWFGACAENGRKWNCQKGIIYQFGNSKIER